MEHQPGNERSTTTAPQAVSACADEVPVAGRPIAVAVAVAVGWSDEWLKELADLVVTLRSLNEWCLRLDRLGGQANGVSRVTARRYIRGLRARRPAYQVRASNGVAHNGQPNSTWTGDPATYIRLMGYLTPDHLLVLMFMHNPGALFDIAGIVRPSFKGGVGSLGRLLEYGMPEFSGQRERCEVLASDLLATGLVSRSLVGTMMNGANLWESSTTMLGKRFLRFISEPEQP